MNDEQRACLLAAKRLPALVAEVEAASTQHRALEAANEAAAAALEAVKNLPPDAPARAQAKARADQASASLAASLAAAEAAARRMGLAQVAAGWAQNPEVLARREQVSHNRAAKALAFAQLDGSDPALVARLQARLDESSTGLAWAEQRVAQVRAAEAAARARL
jgi:hypothetical protein